MAITKVGTSGSDFDIENAGATQAGAKAILGGGLGTFEGGGINFGQKALDYNDDDSFNINLDSGTYDITQTNHFVRIGRLVVIFFDFKINSISAAGTGAVDFGNLPFPYGGPTGSNGGALSRATDHTAGDILVPYIPSTGNTHFRLRKVGAGGLTGGTLQHSELGNAFQIQGQLTYMT